MILCLSDLFFIWTLFGSFQMGCLSSTVFQNCREQLSASQ